MLDVVIAAVHSGRESDNSTRVDLAKLKVMYGCAATPAFVSVGDILAWPTRCSTHAGIAKSF